MIKFTAKFESGYTLVETLVAISILMIAIAGPLTVATKALNAAVDARNQMIAYNLAQESMEFIQNAKDNDSDGTIWAFLHTCLLASKCGASIVETATTPTNPSEGLNSCANFNNCNLTLSSTNGYSYNTASTIPTQFTRTFYITGGSSVGPYDDILVTVTVSWNVGATTNQVEIQKIMSNVTR